MKRLTSLLLALSLILLPMIALADYTSMTDDELQAELNQIRAEMAKRASVKEGKQILAEADGITVTLTGEPAWEKNYDGTCNIVLKVTVINASDEAVGIREDDTYLNGWKVSCSFQTSLEPGTKTKAKITIYKVDEDADLEKIEDLEDIKMTFLTFDGKTLMTKTRNLTTTILY